MSWRKLRDKVKNCDKGEESEDEEKDWLKDYPKVTYRYTLEEVAFLYLKLKQCVKKQRFLKNDTQEESNDYYDKLRERELQKIKEDFQSALDKFHEKWLAIEEKKVERTKRVKNETEFFKMINNLVLEHKLRHREFEAVRKDLVSEFESVCEEEIFNVKDLIGLFLSSFFLTHHNTKMYFLKKI